MGWWRDIGEAVGAVLPSDDLKDLGRTGVPYIDRCIDQDVRNEIERERLRKKLDKKSDQSK
jgi:hypothetical protein